MIRAFGLILLLLAAPFAMAQDVPEPATPEPAAELIGPPAPEEPPSPIAGIDYSAWERTAHRSAAISESGTGSPFALERMRNDLVQWRDQFLAAQGVNAARIATVRQQIASLGEAPGDALLEDGMVASRRGALQAELARLRAPLLLAQEAYAEANGLISEIDSLLRTRRADALTGRGLSPLNPFYWPGIIADLGNLSVSLGKEMRVTFTSASRLAVFKAHLAQVAFTLLFGVLLLLRGRHMTARAVAWGEKRKWRGAGVWALVISAGEVALPLFGLWLLVEGAQASGLVGFRLGQIITALPGVGAYVIVASWLAGRLFSEGARLSIAADIGIDKCGRARRLAVALGWFATASALLRALLAAGETAPVTATAALLPVQILVSIVLFRLGRCFVSSRREEGTEAGNFRRSLLILVGRALMAVAVVGPALTAVGYGVAGEAMIDPMVRSLGLVGVIIVLQSLATELHVLITRSADGVNDALMPVIAAVLLTVAAVPFFILIWGGRAEDLGEIWARMREGFALGETRISPTDFLAFVLIFLLGFLLTRLLQGVLRTTILPRTRMDAGGQTAIISGTGYLGIVIAALVAITSVGLDLSSLAIVAGALSVGIGFGLQNIVSNFISGIILLIERPIAVGDWIEVGGQMGTVRQISVRSTRVETFDRTTLILPNADLISGQVVNWTSGSPVGRVIINVSVVYGSDVTQVLAILREIAEANPMVILNPPPTVILTSFGTDMLNFEVRVILRDINFFLSVKSEINVEIARRFFDEGIEIAGLARANTSQGRTAATMAKAVMDEDTHEDLQDTHAALMADADEGDMDGGLQGLS